MAARDLPSLRGRLRAKESGSPSSIASKEFGITLDGFTIEMAGVRERKRKMVTGLNEMCLENYKNTGALLILGGGRGYGGRASCDDRRTAVYRIT